MAKKKGGGKKGKGGNVAEKKGQGAGSCTVGGASAQLEFVAHHCDQSSLGFR